MNRKISIISRLLIVCAALSILSGSCHNETDSKQIKEMVYVPETPDYTNPLMWHIIQNDYDGSGADVFYIPSTWEFDWTTADGATSIVNTF